MKAIRTLKQNIEDLVKASLVCSSYEFDKTASEITEIANELFEIIEEIETLQHNYEMQTIMIDEYKESLKSSMLNYDECYDKLFEARKYIVELEEILKKELMK